MTLNLATRNALALPDSVVGARTSILGQPGTGKTSTAVVMIEEAAAIGAHFVIIDPTGAWHGLASNAKGNGPGVDCVVMGGQHGDVPLDKDAGRICAELVADQGYNLVLDLDGLGSWAARQHFVADFALELYERAHSQILVVVDEAHRFAPQGRADGDAARCLGAISDLVLLGRRRGIGSITITQRPARLNKDVLEAAELLIAHRVRGNNDAKALGGWIEEHGENLREMLAEVAGLANGRARVSAPTLGINGVFAIRAKRTFDSSRSIEIGEVAIQPTARAEVDMGALRERMATQIEKAKADDPKALRTRIRALEAQLADGGDPQAGAALNEIVRLLLEAGVIAETDEPLDLVRAVIAAWNEMHRETAEAWQQAGKAERVLDAVRAALNTNDFTQDDGARASAPSSTKGVQTSAAPVPSAEGDRSRAAGLNGGDVRPVAPPRGGGNAVAAGGARAQPAAPSSAVNAPRQKILDTIAWFEAIGVRTPKRSAVGPLAGTTSTSSGFEKNLSGLRTAGLIEYPAGGRLALTAEGRVHAVVPEGVPTSEALHDAVLSKLNGPRSAILRTLLVSYPEALSRAELVERVGVSASSSGFEKNLSGLRTLELIDYPQQGMVVAADLLFLGEASTR